MCKMGESMTTTDGNAHEIPVARPRNNEGLTYMDNWDVSGPMARARMSSLSLNAV